MIFVDNKRRIPVSHIEHIPIAEGIIRSVWPPDDDEVTRTRVGSGEKEGAQNQRIVIII